MSWIREQFARLGQFLRSDFRRTVLWCAAGLILSGAAGFAASMLRPELAEAAVSGFADYIAQSGVLDEEGGMSVFALLMNNWRAMLVSALYGFIPFLFLPLLSLVTNGVLLGVMAALYQVNGQSMLLLAAGLLPHGVFELPAIVISISCGVRLCRNMCRLVTSNPDRVPLVELGEALLRVLVLLVAPMTVAAAFVECYVTPAVMGLFM